MTQTETETIAKKAGIILKKDKNFSSYLKNLILKSDKKKLEYIKNIISERMLNYFFNGVTPSKTSLLAIVIVLGLDLNEIELTLAKAGYCLSDCIFFDVVIKKYIIITEKDREKIERIEELNEILSNFSLPLLMTREK